MKKSLSNGNDGSADGMKHIMVVKQIKKERRDQNIICIFSCNCSS